MKQVHPLDRVRAAKPDPRTHHTFRDTGRTSSADDLPSAVFLLRPSWRALLINFMEIAKLALIPAFFVAVFLLLRYIAILKDGTILEPVCNGFSGVAFVGFIAAVFATLPAFGLLQLHSARAEVVNFWDAFIIGLPLTWRFVAVTLLYSLLSGIGLLLLIVPGLYAMHRFMLAPYYVLDHEMGILEAMRASAADAQRYGKPMWSLAWLTLITRATAFIPLVGIFISFFLQIAYLYAPAVRYVELAELDRRKRK